jgi:Na+-transporting NADH:ubiquinone oxidoreductase subunit NqrE
VIETAEAHGVRSYIFIPCIVYGEGEGFGNRISIQTTAVVRAAKKAGAVYDVNSKGAVCTGIAKILYLDYKGIAKITC